MILFCCRLSDKTYDLSCVVVICASEDNNNYAVAFATTAIMPLVNAWGEKLFVDTSSKMRQNYANYDGKVHPQIYYSNYATISKKTKDSTIMYSHGLGHYSFQNKKKPKYLLLPGWTNNWKTICQ